MPIDDTAVVVIAIVVPQIIAIDLLRRQWRSYCYPYLAALAIRLRTATTTTVASASIALMPIVVMMNDDAHCCDEDIYR